MTQKDLEQIIRIGIARDIKVLMADVLRDCSLDKIDMNDYLELLTRLELVEQEADRLLVEAYNG